MPSKKKKTVIHIIYTNIVWIIQFHFYEVRDTKNCGEILAAIINFFLNTGRKLTSEHKQYFSPTNVNIV